MAAHHHHLLQFILRPEVIRAFRLCLPVYAADDEDDGNHPKSGLSHIIFLYIGRCKDKEKNANIQTILQKNSPNGELFCVNAIIGTRGCYDDNVLYGILIAKYAEFRSFVPLKELDVLVKLGVVAF